MLEDLGSRWLAGQPIDPTTFSTLVNAARRGFEAIGLQRVPREVAPTVDRYVASLVGEGKAGNPLNAVTDADRAQVILAVLAENPKLLDQILKQLT
jgi:hypothetical protein